MLGIKNLFEKKDSYGILNNPDTSNFSSGGIFMDNNETAKVEMPQTDPLGAWKAWSVFLLSLLLVLIFYGIGKNIFYSALLFIPVAKIFSGLFNNKMQSIYFGVIALLIYPILLGSSSAMCSSFMNMTGETGSSGNSVKTIEFIVFAVVFFVLMPFMSLGAKALPDKEMSADALKAVQITGFMLGLISGVVLFIVLLALCSSKFFHLPPAILVLLILGAIGLGIAGAVKMVKKVAVQGEENGKQDKNRLQDRPDITLDDVAGMEDVKQQIRLRLIEPVRNPELAERYGLKAGGGVLLYGPPGTGKTFIARAVAGELNLPFYMITSADVFGKYVGESEKNIKAIFENARKNPLSVVFVDEMETIFSKRTDSIHETTQKVISVILQELDGVDKSKNPILLLGATNTPWKIDEAFLRPGRFDILAYVGLPDYQARLQILQNVFDKGSLPYEEGLAEYIAENTESYSGADLNGVTAKIRQRAFDQRAEYYSMQLAYEVLLESSPSNNQTIMENIRRWEAGRLN